MDSTLTLTPSMATVLAVLGLTIILFLFEIVRVDVAGLIILICIAVLGLVPPEHLFDGFASNAVIAIIAVMIIGAGLDRTGLMGRLAQFILGKGRSSERRIMGLVSGAAGIVSGFVPNIGAATLFLPVVSRIAAKTRIPLARLLMPMGFCAILGGTLTMVGSSPLIVLNDLLRASNRSLPPGVGTMEPYSLFAVTPVGLALLAGGILFFLTIGRWLLPRPAGSASTPATPEDYFERTYGITGQIFELVVTADSPLVGMNVGDIEAIEGAPPILALYDGNEARLAPPRDGMVWTGTVLGLMGDRAEIEGFAEKTELQISPRLRNIGRLFNMTQSGICEVVIPPGSRLVGKSIGEIRMRQRYGTSVLAINRSGRIISDDVREVELQPGDTLVMHGSWRELAALARDRNFVFITDISGEPQRAHKVAHAAFFFLLAIGLIVFTHFELSVALLISAVGMIVTGVLSMDEAYQAVSWKTVFLLATLIPLGQAMESSGTAAWIAQEVLVLFGNVETWMLQLAIALLATVLSLLMSNVGATVLLVPLAVNVALSVGADPGVFALIVALSTSNAFLIPTNQVSALIIGPGSYRVVDFLRVGGAMTLLYLAIMLAAVNTLF